MSNHLQAQIEAAVGDALSAERRAKAVRYYELCDLRDAVYAQVQPLEDELAGLNAQIEQLQIRAREVAAQIEAGWGPNWLALKKEIANLGGDLGRPPHTLPSRESLGL